MIKSYLHICEYFLGQDLRPQMPEATANPLLATERNRLEPQRGALNPCGQGGHW